jgi:hypothetical protein
MSACVSFTVMSRNERGMFGALKSTTGVHAQVNSICSLMSCLDYTSRQQYIYYPSNVFCMVSRCDFVLRLMSKTFDILT